MQPGKNFWLTIQPEQDEANVQQQFNVQKYVYGRMGTSRGASNFSPDEGAGWRMFVDAESGEAAQSVV